MTEAQTTTGKDGADVGDNGHKCWKEDGCARKGRRSFEAQDLY